MDRITRNIIIKNNSFQAEQEYWEKKLSGSTEMCGFLPDFAVSNKKTSKISRSEYKLPDKVYQAIMKVSNNSYHMAYVILLAVTQIILNRYTNSADILVGVPVYKGEEEKSLNELIPIRTVLQDKAFKELIIEVKNTIHEAYEKSNYPFEYIWGKSYGTEQKIYKTIVALEELHAFKLLENIYCPVKIIFSMVNSLTVRIEYDSRLFEQSSINEIFNHLKQVFQTVTEDFNIRLEDIDILSAEERLQLICEFNKTTSEYPKDKTVKQLFEERVEKSPNAIAVVFQNRTLTYKELNEKANQVALRLKENGLQSGEILGIMAEHSLEMIIAIIAVLKSGCPYLPIDPSYPAQRIRYMLEDSKPRILLTQEKHMEYLVFEGTVLNLNDETLYSVAAHNPKARLLPDDAAYVIYTSGSSGNPKGVIVSHKSLINLCFWHNTYYQVKSEDVATKYSGVGFDASVWEIFPYLIKGASFHIISDEIRLDIKKLNDYFEENKVTISFLPTQLCEQFMKLENKSLRFLLTGGDKIKSYTKNNYQLVNNYGPTENTVVATSFCVDKAYENIPIGKPISNTKIFILDKRNNLVPVRAIGQLCISGDSLAKGYLNQDELTKEKFVDNPYQPGEKLYLTGDLARWLPDGNIEFLGRMDKQVKIRGYRIELSEIEIQFQKIESIKEVVVLDKEDSNENKYLIAYYTGTQEIDPAKLKKVLSERLPDYMLPYYIVKIDTMPLTQNGKVDRKALLGLPIPTSPDSELEYQPPTNHIEEKLCKIWQEVLGVKRVGIDDSFFDCGGDSIKAIQVSSRLNKYKMKLEIKDLLSNPTIRGTATFVNESSDANYAEEISEGEAPLTPIQKWFFECNFINRHHFNQAMFLYNPYGFDEKIVKKVFENIVKHHDILRAKFTEKDGQVLQYIRSIDSENLFSIDVKEIYDNESCQDVIEKEAEKIQAGINLETGPLVKLGLFKTNQGDHFIIVIHHLVVDAVSFRIILEDFKAGYEQLQNGTDFGFSDKTCSYRQWAMALEEYGNSKETRRQRRYWENIVSRQCKLPADNEIQTRKIRDNRECKLSLSKEDTYRFLKETNKAYNTEANDILLTALGASIKAWKGLDHILISMEGHGRENIAKNIDVTRTVGWFTSQYPLLLDMEKAEDISHAIKTVKEAIRHIPDKGVGYQLLKNNADYTIREKLEYENEITFNYLGQFDGGMDKGFIGISPYSAGDYLSPDSESLGKISINGSVMDDKLQFLVSFNKNEYKEDSILDFTRMFKENLLIIINHCAQKKIKEYTPYDVGASYVSIEDFDEICKSYPAEEIKSIYSLTPMQEGMLFHYLKDTKSSVYFEQFSVKITGKANVKNFEKSFDILMQRYDIFRSSIVYKDLKKPKQLVLKNRTSEVYYKDISYMQEEEKSEYIRKCKNKDRERGFDLSNDNLIRLSILDFAEATKIIIWSFHHIIMDGWCLGIVFNEFFSIYNTLSKGAPLNLTPINEYKNYVDWIDKQDNNEARDYWKEYLGGYEQLTGIMASKSAGKVREYNKEEYIFRINKDLTLQLKNFASKNHATLSNVIHLIWAIILQRYNNTNDVVFGSVVSGRPSEIEGIEKMVGLFVNTLPVRVKSEGNTTVLQLLENIQNNAIKSLKYSYYPLVEIQTDSELKDKLLNHIIAFENYPIQDISEHSKVASEIEISLDTNDVYEQINYDFNIMVGPAEDIIFRFSYNSCLYDHEYIQRISEHVLSVVEQLLTAEDMKVSHIILLNEKEKVKLINEFNDTKKDFPENKTIIDIFVEQAQKTPDNTALIYRDKQTTYKQVHDYSSVMAEKLLSSGSKQGGKIGILMERCSEMILGILSILKAGCAYVPIDPACPKDRLQFILKDSDVAILLTTKQYYDTLCETLSNHSLAIYCLDSENLYIDNKYHDNKNGGVNAIESRPHDLAYIIYTSGSTGNPKGVTVENYSAVNLLNYMQEQYPVSENDTYLLKTNYTFDVSVTEIFGWFFGGGRLAILNKGDEKNPSEILAEIVKNDVTHINFVPSMLNVFLGTINKEEAKKLSCLKYVFSAGEEISTDTVRRFFEIIPHVQLENLYGPTEATVYATRYSITENDCLKTFIPIGKPIQNLNAFILDSNQQITPIGVEGELCLSGVGLARGYLNNPELTNTKFLQNPFVSGERLYRTGDLCKWLSDGNIEYLGRLDHQVKIRGHRIELGEIEAVTNQFFAIKENVVTAKIDSFGDSSLTSYLVLKEDMKEFEKEIKKEEQRQLEDWQVVWNNINPLEQKSMDDSFNIAGWMSSYNGEQISELEMREWLDTAIGRIKVLNPKRVLEIGCGTGMLLFRLIDKCESYMGTDISTKILEYVAKVAKNKEVHHKLTLLNKSAHDFKEITGNKFDTVIINSVAQYFSNTEYFVNVLKNAIRCIEGEGALFLGDIRNFSLLRAFHTSVEIFQASNNMTIDACREHIENRMLTETELLVSPEFFYALMKEIPDITHIEILHKGGTIENELNRFRYDAVLYIHTQVKNPEILMFDWGKEINAAEEIKIILEERKPEVLRLRNIRNKRLEMSFNEMALLEENTVTTMEEFRQQLRNDFKETGCTPEEFYTLNYPGYAVEAVWSGVGKDEYFDIVCYQKTLNPQKGYHACICGGDSVQTYGKLSDYTNNPVRAKFMENVIPNLKQYLREKLPEYMIPSDFIQLNRIPLNSNGKIDRKKLLQIDNSGNSLKNYMAPRNETERKIAEVWKEVLELKRVGIHDDFFSIGGNSIKIIRIISELSKEFVVEINDIFNYRTIEQLAKNIFYSKDLLRNKINIMKEMLNSMEEKAADVNINSSPKRAEYNKKTKLKYKQLDVLAEKKYKNILLIGCTGYLGIYILRQLLKETESEIFLLVHGQSMEECETRLKEKAMYYLSKDIMEENKQRLHIIQGDLTQTFLGMPVTLYKELSEHIDCVINSAANVKHYGNYNDFYEINVRGVERILEFCMGERRIDLNHISTIGVFASYENHSGDAIYNEYDYADSNTIENFYGKTKAIAEERIQEAREKGLKVNIYRIGNIVFDSENGKFQENIEENAFYSVLKAYLKMKVIPDMSIRYDFSFVDYVSASIIKLFNKSNLTNETYHIFNDKYVQLNKLAELFSKCGCTMQKNSANDFFDYLYNCYENKKLRNEANSILVNYGLLRKELNISKQYTAYNMKTNFILNQLGFQWIDLEQIHVEKMLKHCIDVNYLDKDIINL